MARGVPAGSARHRGHPSRRAHPWRCACPSGRAYLSGRAGGALDGDGTSLLETLVALTLLGVLTLYGAPTLVGWRQQQHLEGALRHLALSLSGACARATASGRIHALRFVNGAGELRWTTLIDGDGDGVSEADFVAGIDVPVDAEVDLKRRHPGIEAGRPPGVTTVLGGAADRDGLAFGRYNIVSCTPAGGARSGTLYLRSLRGDGAALRLYGATAKLSAWWWDRGRGVWRRAR